MLTKIRVEFTDLGHLSPVSTERYSSAWYGMIHNYLCLHCQKGTKQLCCTYFGHPFAGVPSIPKGSQKGGATHTAVHWLQAGKKLFLSVVKLFINHLSLIYFWGENVGEWGAVARSETCILKHDTKRKGCFADSSCWFFAISLTLLVKKDHFILRATQMHF